MFKTDDSSLSRRELLAALARAGVAAPFALSSAAAIGAQAPRPPSNVKILGPAEVGPPTAGKAVLTPNDLTFRGFIRFSLEAGNLWYAGGSISLRKVGDQTRAFIFGNVTEGTPVFEYVLPDNPNVDLASAPLARLSRGWGSMLAGRTLTGGNPLY